MNTLSYYHIHLLMILLCFCLQFTSFRLSAESFWALLFGDELLDIWDYIFPEVYDYSQYFNFVMTRIIIALYGLIFPFLILSVVIEIITLEVEQKVHIEQW